MTFEYDSKGKLFTDVVSKVALYATIQTTTHQLRARLHIRRDQRVKDELDRNESFLALTEVTVYGADGKVLFDVPFLAVRREHIVWVIPEQSSGYEKED